MVVVISHLEKFFGGEEKQGLSVFQTNKEGEGRGQYKHLVILYYIDIILLLLAAASQDDYGKILLLYYY